MLIRHWLAVSVLAAAPTTPLVAECIPTPHRTTGTHYTPVTEHKINISKGVIVQGRVLAWPDCTPVANARVAHWQAGEDGRYNDRLRAWLFTDENGRYQFETEWPDMPSPHIHFIVTNSGYQTLETQWVGSERTKQIEFDIVLEPANARE
jgi:protocatechuate 3,4-dioxygenase beta subunit